MPLFFNRRMMTRRMLLSNVSLPQAISVWACGSSDALAATPLRASALRECSSFQRTPTLPMSIRYLDWLSPRPSELFSSPSKLRAKRKPMLAVRRVGGKLKGKADRQLEGSSVQLPPRHWRSEASVGSIVPGLLYSWIQSWVHSNIFPCRSNMPRRLGRNSRGEWIHCLLLPMNHPKCSKRRTSPPNP